MPAPRPVSVSYMDPGSVGMLALRSGEGMLRDRLSNEAGAIIDSTRRYQLGQQEIQSRERMFAIEQAYQNRAGSAAPQQQVQPATTRQQQLDDTLRQMIGQGTLNPDQASWLRLSALGVNQAPINQALGVSTGGQSSGLTPYQESQMQYRQQEDAQQNQARALQQQIEQAEQRVKQYEQSIPGGVAGMSDQERQQYDQLTQLLNQRQTDLSGLYQQFGQGQAPAAAGGQMGQAQGGATMTFEQAQQQGYVFQDANGQIIYWNGSTYAPKP